MRESSGHEDIPKMSEPPVTLLFPLPYHQKKNDTINMKFHVNMLQNITFHG
jgi:hypothetical protein